MRLKAWGERKAMDPPLYVRVREEDGEVTVYLADGDGKPVACGNLLTLFPGEPVRRSPGVFSKYGFPLNKKGQIQIQNLSEETT